MKQTNLLQYNPCSGNRWMAALGLLLLGSALMTPSAAFAGDKKEKGKEVPIVVGHPIVTNDPHPKKK